MPSSETDPAAAAAGLAERTEPYLIGVRHHSPALAAVVPALLDKYRPDSILLELPAEFAEWLPWLGDPETAAPVALAGVPEGGSGPAFYPFADFSPELVAVRWARANDVPVIPCDLPLADRGWQEPGDAIEAQPGQPRYAEALRSAITGRSDEDMWDRVVEARAPGSDPESIRRAALMVGWALRRDAETGPGVSTLDLRREAWMRRCLADAMGQGHRVVAIVGSFHAAAVHAAVSDPATPEATSTSTVVTSLVPYSFHLLDSRSGYPAGIRDPQWQQAVVRASNDPAVIEASTVELVVRVCGRVRAGGHPAGPAEAREAVRLAGDLARLRGLPAPGRGEVVEALQTVLAHGEVLGRGRVVAAAMEDVLVGDRSGVLAAGTPRSGLAPAVRDLLAELKLPGPGEPAKEFRLDPMRSDLDRRREVTLRRLSICDIGYGEQIVTEVGLGDETITTRWRLHWSPVTEATLAAVGLRGVTLAQATEGTLRDHLRRENTEGGPTVDAVLKGLASAASAALNDLAAERLDQLSTVVPQAATLPETIAALALLDRIARGHVPGAELPADRLAYAVEIAEASAVRQLDGLAGSTEPADAAALAALARRAEEAGIGLRLGAALSGLATAGTPLMSAAAGGVQVLLGLADPVELGRRAASWVDNAGDPEARKALRDRLVGLLVVAEPLLHGGGAALASLLDRIDALPDDQFLSRLPALRGGFDTLSPAARERLLEVVAERVGAPDGVGEVEAAATLEYRLLADRAGRAALVALGLPLPGHFPEVSPESPPDAAISRKSPEEARVAEEAGVADGARAGEGAAGVVAGLSIGDIGAADRWRLILGRDKGGMADRARRYATSLDELYGAGRGEGSRADVADRAGREAAFPGVRAWSEELAVLFGPGVREEVLASAVEAGRVEAATEIDPAAVRPSVDLLRDVLALAGGLPESTMARLRPLVAHIIEELTRALATRLRPALSGLTTPRPTYRPGGPLDLPGTLRKNLVHSRRGPDGELILVPEKPVFKSRSRREMDWRLILVVDVSGSMEESVIWSALTASVLAGLPALTTHFLAFSTEVVDLTDRVSDPLSLLLEVSVGGGTHIALGLRHARSLVTVPARTLVAVVSDFEEGYPLAGLLAEVRALAESGCTLLGCASLDDKGKPRYSVGVAGQVVAAGMPVAALSPLELARWVAEKVHT